MEEHREIVDIQPVSLGRDDLPVLEALLIEDLHPREDSIAVSVGDGSRVIRAKSVAELLEMKLPKVTNDFGIRLMSWTQDHGTDASLSVTLYHNFAHYQLSSTSETVFLGKKAELDSFFRRHRPWYSSFKRLLPGLGQLPLFAGMFGAAYFGARHNYLGLVLAVCLALASVLVLWLDFTGRAFPYVRVRLDEAPPRPSGWEVAVFALNVALLIATLTGLVVAVVKS